jgi:hypothetical protein
MGRVILVLLPVPVVVILVPVAVCAPLLPLQRWFWDEIILRASRTRLSLASSMGSLPGAAAAGPGGRAWVVRVCIFAALVRMACAPCAELTTTDAFTVGVYTYTVRQTDSLF